MSEPIDRVCPVCREGTMVDIEYDADPASREPVQRADSREVIEFSCGHLVVGPSLASADEERLDVERRTSDQTVDTEG